MKFYFVTIPNSSPGCSLKGAWGEYLMLFLKSNKNLCTPALNSERGKGDTEEKCQKCAVYIHNTHTHTETKKE